MRVAVALKTVISLNRPQIMLPSGSLFFVLFTEQSAILLTLTLELITRPGTV